MEFPQVVMQRYATKTFDGKKVPQEKFAQLQELIRNAASSYNIQPWRIKVVTDDATKKALAPHAWNQPQITTCSHLLVFCADTELEDNIDMLAKAGAPEQYVAAMHGFAEGLTGERRLAWAQRQVYLALGNAINGAKALGLDSCPMEGFSPEEFAKVLKLPANIVPTTLCPIGYASDAPKPKVRFPKEHVFF